ncbi:putative ABC transport system ATP-binding protein [Nitrosomonas ureae]|jgi:putative ABC transport system ATP-binding protein|uniref:Putative ABC transport system ATP-binding protein n=1 Tax=Nitrosomonas ureae TaxID=44577 RepID=A0A285C1C3_9PROT|nr:ABC transporter ATP-binding protein [Nitrosomonas ureae]MBY0498887.1 ABC transporter ATP-binding protein [Nitrosomonas sp.]SNX61364.1 putative ABC transport system ATP-binding protein [Nitrosomonas ureae]
MLDNHVNQPILWTHALTKQVSTGDTQLTILQDIDLQVYAGEAVAIIGASGSGKSTLLGLLAGLDLPTAGKVHLDAVDIFTLDEDSRAALRGKILGFVFQSFQLLPALTAIENVMLPLELSQQNKNAEAIARKLLERVGLAKRLNHYPKQLSGGEQQRVAIARAFATDPKLLLADEPTGNLDSATGIQIIDLMFELNREHGTTLVLVTHDEVLSRRCSRQIRLADGKLVQ